MRTIAWLLLFVSFVLGLVSAFVVAYFTLDAKPVVVVDTGPTVKILVAQKEIPIGAEITADYVEFRDVPVAEIPSHATTNFMQIYRRRPAYPLTVGCPVCEDLLLPRESEETQSVKYLPVGSQVVSLEVEQLRVGTKVSEFEIPLSNVLSIGDHVDIRVIPMDEGKGEYVQRKNEILKTFAAKDSPITMGELVLENVGIYGIAGKQSELGGKQIQTVSLLLENGQAEKLNAAARDGRLRIMPHQKSQQSKLEPSAETQPSQAVAHSSDNLRQTALEPDNMIATDAALMNTTSTDIATVNQLVELEHLAERERRIDPIRGTEDIASVPRQPVRLLDSSRYPKQEETTAQESRASDNQSSEWQINRNQRPRSASNEHHGDIRPTSASLEFRSAVPVNDEETRRNGANVSFVTPQKASTIQPKVAENCLNTAVNSSVRPRPQSTQHIIEIGLASDLSYNGSIRTTPTEISHQRNTGYSPFNNSQRRLAELETDSVEQAELPQPPPLRTRFR